MNFNLRIKDLTNFENFIPDFGQTWIMNRVRTIMKNKNIIKILKLTSKKRWRKIKMKLNTNISFERYLKNSFAYVTRNNIGFKNV